MKNLKTLGIAGGLVAATLIGGTLISVVAASPDSSPASTTDGIVADSSDLHDYCATWQQAFADEPGVSVEDLAPAAKAATIAAIDRAVEDGDIPSDVADELKARINDADGDGCRLLGGFLAGIGRHAAAADGIHDLFGAAASALGMTNEELFSALRSGSSLQEIAADQKVDYDNLTQIILDAAKTDLDALVATGHLTQERADAMLSRLEQLLQSGEFLSGDRFGPDGFGFHHR